MSLTQKQNYGKSASFVVIMLLHNGVTHIQSHICFGESFTLNKRGKKTKKAQYVSFKKIEQCVFETSEIILYS